MKSLSYDSRTAYLKTLNLLSAHKYCTNCFYHYTKTYLESKNKLSGLNYFL